MFASKREFSPAGRATAMLNTVSSASHDTRVVWICLNCRAMRTQNQGTSSDSDGLGGGRGLGYVVSVTLS